MSAPRNPLEPSTAAIRAAEDAETTFRDVYDAEERLAYSGDRVRTMLAAAYVVDAVGGLTVERLTELLLASNNWETGVKLVQKFTGREARILASWVVARLQEGPAQ